MSALVEVCFFFERCIGTEFVDVMKQYIVFWKVHWCEMLEGALCEMCFRENY